MSAGQKKPLRYAITDLSGPAPSFTLDAQQRRRSQWLAHLRRWTTQGIDYIQLREKHLDAGELYALAEAARQFLNSRPASASRPKLLLNTRTDIAAAARADGVHLTSHPAELTPTEVRGVFRAAGLRACTVSTSCHTLQQVTSACEAGADLILFGPVFEKRVRGELVTDGTGLELLRTACTLAHPTPVLALGGITDANTSLCLSGGAAGIAGIRLFAGGPNSPT